jgi:hypothetical protein
MSRNRNLEFGPRKSSTLISTETHTGSRFGRRSFLKRLGFGGTALLPAASWLASENSSEAEQGGGISNGDVALLRFLAAAEIIETDLWQQYNELALGNAAFQNGLFALDGDMPTYVNQNTRDEFTHQDFINAYLESKGHARVSLEKFRRLPSSQADGANKSGRRLTNLMNLTVDTSWYTRYRSEGNPDFGDTFAQIVDLVNVPAIPNSNLAVGGDDIQVIANTAGFHFATIEQGGSSLYASMLPKANSAEVIRIIAAIGGTEVMHFEVWQDKAGNAPPVPLDTGARFPQLPIAPEQTPNGIDPASPNDTNQIMPRPCKFISPNLPLVSVIRPTLTANAGAVAAATGFANSGLFNGQDQEFFNFFFGLAEAADNVRRGS